MPMPMPPFPFVGNAHAVRLILQAEGRGRAILSLRRYYALDLPCVALWADDPSSSQDLSWSVICAVRLEPARSSATSHTPDARRSSVFVAIPLASPLA